MTVTQFIDDCKKDLAGQGSISPRLMSDYKTLVWHIDELLENDKPLVHKFKKTVKGLDNAANNYMTNEMLYAEALENLGSVALFREAEASLGDGFLRLSRNTKELGSQRKTMIENFNNMVLFPLNSLLKGDMNKVGDMKKPCEEAWKEFKSKGIKKDKDKGKKTEIVLYRINPPESSEESERERRMFMYNACEYLMKANDVKIKKGVELVQHLIEYNQAQLRYFTRGIELVKEMGNYFEGVASEIIQLKMEHEEEKKALTDLKNQLKTILQLDCQKEVKGQNYSIHGIQGDKNYGGEKQGTLLKRSEGVRKQWQKRYCVIKDGQFKLAHNQQSAPSVNLNLLTCQVKPSPEKEKRLSFALVAHNRTYLFQAEDETDYEAWISVVSNAREEALNKAFGEGEGALSKEPVTNISELTQGIISEVQRIPGNTRCVDCNAGDPTWLSTNLGILVCIECSGIHRDLGVHMSRIRSLTLDRLGTAELLLAKAVGNSGFNEIMEAELDPALKPGSNSPMEARKEFIQQKYVHRKYTHASNQPSNALHEELIQAINHRDILAVLQLYADGVDFTSPMLDHSHKGCSLHYCIEKEDLTSIHIVDFIIQNCKNVNYQNSQGNTALHLSALINKPECAKLLVRGGIKVDSVNKEGKTALDVAKDNGHTDVAELLQDAIDGKTGKFDHIKIDWGLQEAEDIYATPIDIHEMKLHSELDGVLKRGVSLKTPVSRAMTPPSSVPKTTAVPTPDALPTANTPYSRHTVAYANSIQPSPSPLPRKLSSECIVVQPPPLPERSHGPPPPPVRKITKLMTPSPLVVPPAHSMNIQPLSSPQNDPISPPILSTFNPKSSGKPQGDGISPGPPPTPPTRSTSFIPRVPETDSLSEFPPPPLLQSKGHTRNASDGEILVVQDDEAPPKHRPRTNSAADVLTIPIDPDAPPLPPPRPKQIQLFDVSTTATTTTASTPLSTSLIPRTQSASKRLEKVKHRRAKALYDCDADHEDELSFVEGEIIIMVREADPDWWFGEVEGQPERNGVFPISFVHVLNE